MPHSSFAGDKDFASESLPETDLSNTFSLPTPKRVDLHVHSRASRVAGEAALNFIACPESFSPPQDVYDQAKRRGMDFVTLTDHDSIAGAVTMTQHADFLIGQEVTTYFPEDHCKIHLLVWGIDEVAHETLQELAPDIYELADYIERRQIAHAVAHPLYRQNDVLDRWHLERLLLMFKGFECINGAHAPSHAAAMDAVLDRLTRQEMQRLAEVHDMLPRWSQPWFKARTAGSDDHGLLNVGRTFTEFPHDTRTVDDVLRCLREGACQPAGESGSSLKLAHTLYAVGIRYHADRTGKGKSSAGNSSVTARVAKTLAGIAPPPTPVEQKLSRLSKRARMLLAPFAASTGSQGPGNLFMRLLNQAAGTQFSAQPELFDMARRGAAPLGEHEEMFRFAGDFQRIFAELLADELFDAADKLDLTKLFDGAGALLAQQLAMFPYYFSLFHQNKERHLLGQITRFHRPTTPDKIRVGLFTDTFDDINGVGRFIRDMGEQALSRGYDLTIHTSVSKPRYDLKNRVNFKPMLARKMPFYETLEMTVPPVVELLEYADRKQYDVIHISTPGAVGFTGYLAARMLRVPILSTYHTDFPAYVEHLTGDHRMTMLTRWFMSWFYAQSSRVFSRSGSYHFNLRELGLKQEAIRTISPGINTTKFSDTHRCDSTWPTLGVTTPFKLLYVGRISVEKNLPLLVEIFKQVCATRTDATLVVAGEGPYEAQMKEKLAGLPVCFTGPLNDQQLGPVYAGATIFVFPSRTDTLGQVVMEAQASALPTLVAPEGGPRESIVPGVSGLVLSGIDALPWVSAINDLLDDPAKLQAMSAAARERSKKFDIQAMFDSFWHEHVTSLDKPVDPEIAPPPVVKQRDATSTAVQQK